MRRDDSPHAVAPAAVTHTRAPRRRRTHACVHRADESLPAAALRRSVAPGRAHTPNAARTSWLQASAEVCAPNASPLPLLAGGRSASATRTHEPLVERARAHSCSCSDPAALSRLSACVSSCRCRFARSSPNECGTPMRPHVCCFNASSRAEATCHGASHCRSVTRSITSPQLSDAERRPILRPPGNCGAAGHAAGTAAPARAAAACACGSFGTTRSPTFVATPM